MFCRQKMRRRIGKDALPWAVFVALSIPNLFQVIKFYSLFSFKGSEIPGLLQGNNWGPGILLYNIGRYGVYIFNGAFQPVIVSIFALIGAVIMFRRQKNEFLSLCIWVGLFGLFYFFSRSLTIEDAIVTQGRFFMNFYPAMIIFSSLGIAFVLQAMTGQISRPDSKRYVYVAAIILIILVFLPYVSSAARMFSGDAHRLETKVPELAERDALSSCAIVTNWPTILTSTTELHVVDIRDFLDSQDYQKQLLETSVCVLFFQDLMCEMGEQERANCAKIQQEYVMREYRSYAEGSKKYAFLQLLHKKKLKE